jgi:hypothetical protein
MTCPVCGTPLGASQTRCSGCGYSFSEPLDLQADVAPPGVRPKEVILAARLLAVQLALSAAILFSVLSKPTSGVMLDHQGRPVGTYSASGDPAWIFSGVIALNALFIALIWWGVGWARTLFLIKVGIIVAIMIWRLMAAVTVNQVSRYLGGMYGSLSLGTAIDLLVAYLLLQPESRIWFYGKDVAM